LSQPRQPISVGKYFLERGRIDQQQLQEALRYKEEHGYKLGQALVALAYVGEGDLIEALRYQARFPCIHLRPGLVDTQVAMRLSGEHGRRLRAIPLNHVAKHTTVAMDDPSDDNALLQLGELLGTPIFPVYAESSAISSTLEWLHGKDPLAPQPMPAAAPEPAPPIPTPTAAAPAPTAAARSGAGETAFRLRAAAAPTTATPAEATDGPDDKRVLQAVRGFLEAALERGASDVHVEPRAQEVVVRMRLDGTLREHARLPRTWAGPVVRRIKSLSHMDSGRADEPQSGHVRFEHRKGPVDLHVSTTPAHHGEGVVLHIESAGSAPRTLADLGLTSSASGALDEMLATGEGLVLVVGPARSGRTTMLHALAHRLAGGSRKVVALEPSDASLPDGVLHVATDGRAERAFVRAWHAALLQDPDVLVTGDLSDVERARSALEAALAGRHVVASLRARSAPEALDRLCAAGLEPYLLADALRGTIGVRLVRRVCTGCRKEVAMDEQLFARLGVTRKDAPFHEGKGCASCHGSGFVGRVGLHEIRPLTVPARRALERGEGLAALVDAVRTDGLPGLLQDALHKARDGQTSLREVLMAAGAAPTPATTKATR